MKDNIKIIVAIVLIIALSFSAGYMSNSGKYDIVNKQDELVIIYNDIQANMNTLIKGIEELEVVYETMKKLETLSDTDVETMDAIPKQIVDAKQLVMKNKMSLINLKFTYGVLQEMR